MIIAGKNSVKEYIKTKGKIYEAYLYNNFNDEDILNGIKDIKYKYMDKYELDKLYKGNHQGIIIKVDDYKYYNLDELLEESNFFVMLDHLEDPHNFGAIIRTCEAAGVNGIIIPQDRSVEVSSTVIKVSSGAINFMPICKVVNLPSTINKLKANGFWIVGMDMDGSDYKNIDYSGKICLIIGSEGKGLSNLVKKSCDYIASIPMEGKVNSLNASVASAIIIYEAKRFRK